jgi:hypothetical protein
MLTSRLLAPALSIALILFLAFAGLGPRPSSTSAGGPVVLGGDPIVAGNTATSLSTTEGCVSVASGDTFDFDLFVSGVQDLVAWEMYVKFDPPIVRVVEADLWQFLAGNPRSSLTVLSEPLSGGRHFVGAADTNGAPESGSGVLARLKLEATGSGRSSAIVYKFDVDGDGDMDFGPRLTMDGGGAVGDIDGDGVFDGDTHGATITVDGDCDAGTGGPPSGGGPPAGGGGSGGGSNTSVLDRLLAYLNDVDGLFSGDTTGAAGDGSEQDPGGGDGSGSGGVGDAPSSGEGDGGEGGAGPSSSEDGDGPADSDEASSSSSDGDGLSPLVIGAIIAAVLVLAGGAGVLLAMRAGGRAWR